MTDSVAYGLRSEMDAALEPERRLFGSKSLPSLGHRLGSYLDISLNWGGLSLPVVSVCTDISLYIAVSAVGVSESSFVVPTSISAVEGSAV